MVAAMLRSLLRITLKLGTVGAMVALVAKLLQRRRSDAGPPAGPGTWPRLDLPEEGSTAAPPAAEAAALEREAAELERRMAATATELVGASTAAPDGAESSNGSEAPTAWVEPDDATCPASHPVKAKMTSKVFHLPGMAHYGRTRPDRCYPDAASAEADGLRQAKR